MSAGRSQGGLQAAGGATPPDLVPPPPLGMLPLQQQQQLPAANAQPMQQASDVWVTVYGFWQPDVPLVLQEFGSCGDIVQWGTFGVPQANFLHIQVRACVRACVIACAQYFH